MKNIKLLFTPLFLAYLVVIFSWFTVYFSNAYAAGGWDYTVSVSGSPATANGSNSVKITVYSYFPTKSDPLGGQDICLSVSGSGNSLSAANLTTASSGYAYSTLKSTVAETKTITATDCTPYYSKTASAKFVAASSSSSTSSSSSSGSSTSTNTSSSSAAESSEAEASPEPKEDTPATKPIDTKLVYVNNSSLTKLDETLVVKEGKPITVSGTTIPGGMITLYVHSETKIVHVTADKNGKWSSTITGLAEGLHYIEAEVTNPSTMKTSKKVQLLEFIIEKPAAAKQMFDKGLIPFIAIGSLVTVAIVGGVVFAVVLRARRSKNPNDLFDSPV